MRGEQAVSLLRQKIESSLLALIDSDYHLLEVPYYANVGDMLIWQGELDFLRNVPHKCRGMHSLETFRYRDIAESDIILFQGGGNFGDLWTCNHQFKMDVAKAYPRNKMIFFPQSVWFNSHDNLLRCANDLKNLQNVTICARDERSYKLLQKYFSNSIMLVPDMAFCMDMSRWRKPCNPRRDLLLLRNDAESRSSSQLEAVRSGPGIDISDWPSMEQGRYPNAVLYAMKILHRQVPYILDLYAQKIYRKKVISSGVEFVSRAKHVYTTRLHGAILALLLGKRVSVFDNSYGKCGDFVKTWLSDCSDIELSG